MSSVFRCGHCNARIDGRKNRRYCSHQCQIAHYNDVTLYNAKGRRITPTVGAVSELVVSADILDRGIPVFRALSPAAPFDLTIVADSQLYGIEVRTGHRNARNGKVDHEKHHQGADIFAVYIRKEHAVLYFGITERGTALVKQYLGDPNRKWWLDARPVYDVLPLSPPVPPETEGVA